MTFYMGHANAFEKGEVLKLTDEAKFALKTSYNIQFVKKMDTLEGDIDVWAVIPLSNDGQFHPLRILYILPDGRILAGNIFDKDLNLITLKYAASLQNSVLKSLYGTKDALTFNFNKGANNKWTQHLLILSSSDKWLRFVRLFNEMVETEPSLQTVPFNVYYRPMGNSNTPSASSLAWGTQGQYFSALASHELPTDKLSQYASQASSQTRMRLAPIYDFSNQLAETLGLPNRGDYVVYQDRKLEITSEITPDDITVFLFGHKISEL